MPASRSWRGERDAEREAHHKALDDYANLIRERDAAIARAEEAEEATRAAVGHENADRSKGTNVSRLCDRHARAAWVRVCEVVSACVMAACVEDYARALREAKGTRGWRMPRVREALYAAQDALCGRTRG